MSTPRQGSDPGGDSGRGSVSGPVALAFAVVGFFAIVIAAFGMTSLLLDADVIAVAGLGQIPGVVGIGLATAAFAGVLWLSLRRPHPRYTGAAVVAVASFLASIIGIWIGALISGIDPARATAAAGSFATSWFALILTVAAFVAGWAGIALVRTRAGRPRWHWEDRDGREEDPTE